MTNIRLLIFLNFPAVLKTPSILPMTSTMTCHPFSCFLYLRSLSQGTSDTSSFLSFSFFATIHDIRSKSGGPQIGQKISPAPKFLVLFNVFLHVSDQSGNFFSRKCSTCCHVCSQQMQELLPGKSKHDNKFASLAAAPFFSVSSLKLFF